MAGFENRTRFLREVVEEIQTSIPDLNVAVRFSAFDLIPYQKAANGRGTPEPWDGLYEYGFGCDARDPLQPRNLAEARKLIATLAELGVDLVCLSAGSPSSIPMCSAPPCSLLPTATTRRKTPWSALPDSSWQRPS